MLTYKQNKRKVIIVKSRNYYEGKLEEVMKKYGNFLEFDENMKRGIGRNQFSRKSTKEFPMNIRSKVTSGDSDKYEWIRINNVDELWIYYHIVFQTWMGYVCPDIISYEERMDIYKTFRDRYLQWNIDRVLDDVLDMGIDAFLDDFEEKKARRSGIARQNKYKHLKIMQGYENPHITKERRKVEKTIARLKKEGKWYRKKKKDNE